MESLAFDTSVIALTVLHGAKHGLNPSEVEAATRALNIYSIARVCQHSGFVPVNLSHTNRRTIGFA